MNSGNYALGIDIGGTNTVLGVVSATGKISWKNQIKTKDYASPQQFVQAIYQSFSAGFKGKSIDGIGVGAPNANFFTGEIQDAANLPWKGIIPLRQMLEKAFRLPVCITNDANAGALGEMTFGTAKKMKDFAFITLGTGLGSGIVANGKLIYGNDGFAGELGHTIAVRGGRPCGCGRRGCLETYVSAPGIVTTAMEYLQEIRFPRENNPYWLVNLQERQELITASAISRAAEQGDPTAFAVFEDTAKILGASLSDLVALFSPEAIIFFGGLSNAGELLLKPTKRYLEENLLSVFKNKVKLLVSGLKEGDAALLGAASLVWG